MKNIILVFVFSLFIGTVSMAAGYGGGSIYERAIFALLLYYVLESRGSR